MKQSKIISIVLIVIFIGCSLIRCETNKDGEQNLSIILYDKPLSIIQSYIDGEWNLVYGFGGIAGQKYIDTINSYLIFNSDHITMGNDTRGIYVDTTLIWKRIKIQNDSVYLFGHPNPNNDPIIYRIIQEIKNDTLIIRDYIDDGFWNYYIR